MPDTTATDTAHILDRIRQADSRIAATRAAQEHAADDKARAVADLAAAHGGGKAGAEAAAAELGVSPTTVYKAVTRSRNADAPHRRLPPGWPERLLAAELADVPPLPACHWQALAWMVRGTIIDDVWVDSSPGELLADDADECDDFDEPDRSEIAAAARLWTRPQALAVIDACQRGDLDALPTAAEDRA